MERQKCRFKIIGGRGAAGLAICPELAPAERYFWHLFCDFVKSGMSRFSAFLACAGIDKFLVLE